MLVPMFDGIQVTALYIFNVRTGPSVLTAGNTWNKTLKYLEPPRNPQYLDASETIGPPNVADDEIAQMDVLVTN